MKTFHEKHSSFHHDVNKFMLLSYFFHSLIFCSRYSFGTPLPHLTAIEREIIQALTINNITKFFDMLKLFEINDIDMFHDNISKIFLSTGPGMTDYPTCRLNYKHKCEISPTLSWREFTQCTLIILSWYSQ